MLVHELHVFRARSRTCLLNWVVDSIFEWSLGLSRLRFVLLDVHGLGHVFRRHAGSLLSEVADSATSSSHRIVFLAAVMNLKILFNPLAHLSVIEQTALHQLVHIQIFLDSVFVESTIEYLEVILVLVLSFGVPFDLLQLHSHWVDLVDDLTVNRASATLLNLGEIQI